MYEEDMPKIILVFTVALIILLLGAFITSLIVTETGIEDSIHKYQDVVDQSNDVDVDMGYDDLTITRVRYYADGAWHIIDAGNYTYTGDTVTIDKDVWGG